jgi:hypothetical protein
MIISLRRIRSWLRFLFLFVLFTLLLYQLFRFVSPLFEPDYMYREPSGGAIKVFAHQGTEEHPRTLTEEIAGRLFLFYRIGE